jgi:hypothetical protein
MWSSPPSICSLHAVTFLDDAKEKGGKRQRNARERERVIGAIPLEGRRGAMSRPPSVVIGSLFGPAQVLSRLINMIFGIRLSPPVLAVIAAALMVVGILILGLSGSWLPGAVAFAICLGLGSGINSIAQGSLPLSVRQRWLRRDHRGDGGGAACDGRRPAFRLRDGNGAVRPSCWRPNGGLWQPSRLAPYLISARDIGKTTFIVPSKGS